MELPHHLPEKILPGYYSRLEMRFTLEESETKTQVRDEWKLDTGKPGIIEKLATGNAKSAAAENLIKLKQLLEQVRLYCKTVEKHRWSRDPP